MSSSALRIIAILLALGALALGYTGYQTSQTPLADNPEPVVETAPPAPVRHPVLIAARDIKTGESLNENNITTMFVNKLPEDTYSEQQQVIGQQVRLAIPAGHLILKDHFHDFSHLVTAIRPGERAIAVRVDEVTGVGGFIQPGDFVDVFLFLKAGQETGDKSSAQRVLSAARVLAYGNTVDATNTNAITEKAKVNDDSDSAASKNDKTASEAAESEQDEPTGKLSKTAVLAIKDKDLSSLLLAESTGRLRLALLGPEAIVDNAEINKPKTTADLDAAQEQQRQIVTLDVFNVKPANTSAQTQPAIKHRTVRSSPPPSSPKVTVHRGINAASVSVDREN